MSATLQITSLADGKLLISEPVEYLLGLTFLLPATLLAAYFVYRAFRSGTWFPLWGVLICLPFGLAGVRAMFTGHLQLDRAHNSASFYQPTFFSHREFDVPLDQISHAEVRGRLQSDYIAVVLRSGDALNFTDSTQTGGKGRAAKAINDYIGYTAR